MAEAERTVRMAGGTGAVVPKALASELKFRGKFLLALLLVSYIVMKIILYLTRVLAYYFVNGVWKLV